MLSTPVFVFGGKNMWLILAVLLLIPVPSFADNFLYSVSVCSSSVGTDITGGIQKSMIVSAASGAATTVFLASMDSCSSLTSAIGAPLNAASNDAAVSINGKADGDGRWCAILKTGSTCVVVGVNLIGN
jgi:hypothetical protein